MTEIESVPVRPSGIERRTILKGAAWAVPVMAVAVAAPLASASVNTSGLAVTASETSLATLNLLEGGGTVTATALITRPSQITVTNGPGAISQTATFTVTVGRPAGVNISVGRARGFGVYSFNGVPSTAGQRTAVYQTAPVVGQYGFPLTTFTTSTAVTVPSNGSLNIPIVFGLAGVSTGVAVSALTTFPVTVVADFGGGVTRTATSSVVVPVGAGVL